MIRTSAILLTLLVLAAVPARAQETASFAPAATPLPALLQPSSRTEAPAAFDDPILHVVRGAGIGAAVGCLVIGVLAASVDMDPEPPSGPNLGNGLYGCAIGALAGGMLGGTAGLVAYFARGH